MTGRGVISGASVSHDRATVDELESAATANQRVVVDQLTGLPAVDEAFVLQTCNRVEAYVVTVEEADGRAALAAFFDEVADDVVVEMGHEESLRHLMRVAAGLESLVVGEDQIIGQVGDAFEDAHAADGVGPVLEQAVTKAIRVGERARTETEINEGSVSLASAAVKLAVEEGALADGAANATADGDGDGDGIALVIGVGEMGRLAAKTLADHVDTLYVANRTVDHARHLADAVDVETVVVDLDAVGEALEAAAVVVTATDSDEYVLGRESFADVGETFVVDIARPRDIPPAVTELPWVTVHDLDTLQTVTDENERKRAAAAATVQDMIDVEFERLLTQYKRNRADDVISAMYESAERVKARELDTAFERTDFDEGDREVVESMADAIVNQLLSAPTESLRDAAENDDWSTINTALQLFDPEFGPASVPTDALSGEDPSLDGVPEPIRDRIASGAIDGGED